MADLVTHVCSVLLPAAWSRHRAVPLLGVGAALPDLASRLPGEGLELLSRTVLPVPEALIAAFGVCHEPLPLLALTTGIAIAFRREDRVAAAIALGLGVGAHLGLDLLQDHHGHGYRLLFPLSSREFELGWLHSEATVAAAPWLAVITMLAWAPRLRQRPSAASGNSPPSTPGPVS